jgi:hypothetical protein
MIIYFLEIPREHPTGHTLVAIGQRIDADRTNSQINVSSPYMHCYKCKREGYIIKLRLTVASV